MKRSFIIMLVCILLFIFSACGNNNVLSSSYGANSPEELVGKLEELYKAPNPSDDGIAVLTYEYVFAKNEADKRTIEYSAHCASMIDLLRGQYGDDTQVTFSNVDINKNELSEEKLQSLRSALAASYNDTDKIEDICLVIYDWKASGSSGQVADTMREHYIKVGDKWYLFETYTDYYYELDLK